MKNQSTYSMLVNSTEKGRDLFETAVYAVVALSAVVMVGHSAMQSDSVRSYAGLKQAPAAPVIVKQIAAQPLAAKF
ncbi:hypothetical protein BH20VER2_BH20VER2_18120 [soil metagenome]